ncbi:class I SAM-dependent DNA methyltransferase [Arenimonas fontis]|uniref:site-specific DNA-methyltransferase (adenine-specific) n=1 Tax=Arenimonas fontis TaxID=2608255 RepID=A0A5B2Z9X5_9GAMM|nr:DNA methyltransferase [Arenimonas fontis]KAA2284735.1 class I SAM-dependent DNA methyltransferase [Arenimonas fontis]
MPLSWNEIKDRALRFSQEWADVASEDAEAKTFWDQFFDIFGVSRKRVASFEKRVKKIDGKDGYIDLLWKGVLLVEHKSRGKDLDRAHAQARDYFHGLSDAELPRYLLVSDFARFRLYDLEGEEAPLEFPLEELYKHVHGFGFIAGYQTHRFKEEDPVNVQAAERMGRLHDALREAGYEGHALEVFLVRLLFCLFADDTGIFGERQYFHELIRTRTSPDGSDLGMWLAQIFQTLNTPEEKRQKTLDEQLAALPYVNGRLFEEILPLAAFNAKMRQMLLDASALDWSRISPAIFGSMFQSVMDEKARRNLGAHYTSEKNILKLIGPLFLDELKAELEKAGNNDGKLKALHLRLANLRLLDPACGCGNFLVIAYRELRLLELEILKRLYSTQASVLTKVSEHVAVDVDQFYGIEIEEFPAQIAQVALWLMDHQMNQRVAEQFGEYFARLPLTKSPTIVHGNALRLDWDKVVPADKLDYILGNPPFVGAKLMSPEQRQDLLGVAGDLKGAGLLDLVAAWYLKAADYMQGTGIRCAFVSTNSIAQGEQVGVLWKSLLGKGIHIHFAHRTFQWTNEARGIAAVHCVIIGFGTGAASGIRLFEYESPRGDALERWVSRLNPYLVDADDILLPNRTAPICNVPIMKFGNQPIDGGNLVLMEDEREKIVSECPAASSWIRPFLGADEYINGGMRYCLWLKGAEPSSLKGCKPVLDRVNAVQAFRLSSKRQATRELADRPAEFAFVSHEECDYVVVPSVSSERRKYIPMGFLPKDVIASNLCLIIPGASKYELGVLVSEMHMAWVRQVCGRLESRYRYSAGIVYNNFPWPEIIEEKYRADIEQAAQGVLDARAAFPNSTLADLYDPLTMPPALLKAHKALDKAVDTAYIAAEKAAGRKPPKLGTDAERVAFLFERYQALTSLLSAAKKPARRKRAAKAEEY